MKLTLSEELMHTTIRIEILNEHFKEIGSGTGFFFKFDLGNGIESTVLVTNKHVVEGTKVARLVFTESNKSDKPLYGRKFDYIITDFDKKFIFHPSASIDLCIMPMETIIEEEKEKNNNSFFIKTLDESLILSNSEVRALAAIEDIIMIGYPNGLWDEKNNLPIIRKGITAVHPKINFQGKPNLVLDIASYPGSSGSPIFLYNNGMYVEGNGMKFGSRLFFMGILHSGPVMESTGEIIEKPISINTNNLSVHKMMINLGYAVKSRKLLDFKDLLNNRIKSQNKG